MRRNRNRRRILIAKLGLDGHDVGARVVARGLSENGMEVKYSGIRRTPEEVAEMALEHEAIVVGVSILSGAHLQLLPRLRQALDKNGGGDIAIVVGGVIPQEDISLLKSQGVEEVFLSGTSIKKIVARLDHLHYSNFSSADANRLY